MKLRTKLLIGVFLIIVSLAGVYLGISLLATDMAFDRYERYVEKQITDQLQNALAVYYLSNGESWRGIEQHLLPLLPHRERHLKKLTMVLLDEKEQPIAAWPRGVEERWRDTNFLTRGTRIPIQIDDRQVGTLWLPTSRAMGVEGTRARVSSWLIGGFLISILISSVIAFGVSYLLANRLTRPLHQLAEATHEVKKRRFDLRLPVPSRDEVGTVVKAFNEMNEELQRGEQIRRNLVADVAHELRTPLTVIQGQLESIQQGVLPPSVESVMPILDEVIRLNRLVEDLRQLTLAEAGKLPLRMIPTDVNRIIQRIVDIFSVDAEARNIRLEVTTDEKTIEIQADPDRLTQIIINILGNALRYSPEKSLIRIGATRILSSEGLDLYQWCQSNGKPMEEKRQLNSSSIQGQEKAPEGRENSVLIWVTDQGPGIAPDHLPFVFDRFYRSAASRDRETGGAGLGLAIAREFVLAHGGQITVANRREGGSCFAFYLPVNPEVEKTCPPDAS